MKYKLSNKTIRNILLVGCLVFILSVILGILLSDIYVSLLITGSLILLSLVSVVIYNLSVSDDVEKLRLDLEKFKLAVEYSSDHIAITDPDGNILYGNKSVERITGYPVSEVVGQKAGKAWGGLMPKEYYAKMWKTIKIDKKPFNSVLKNKRKNGEIYDAEVTISPVLSKNGSVVYFVAIERDITTIMNQNRSNTDLLSKIKAKNDQLEKMNRFMTDRELKMRELKKQIEELKQNKNNAQ